MDLTAMQTELKARGFDYLSTTRLNYFLNAGYHAFCEAEAWPFLETTATGNSPLAVTDLRNVLYVVDTTNGPRLPSADSRDIVDDDPLTTTAGTPSCYWLDNNTVRVHPVAVVALSVRYLKVPADLASGGDTPVVPTRYHDIVVDLAQIEALKERGGWGEAQALREDVGKRLALAQASLEDRTWDDPSFVVTRPGSSTDW